MILTNPMYIILIALCAFLLILVAVALCICFCDNYEVPVKKTKIVKTAVSSTNNAANSSHKLEEEDMSDSNSTELKEKQFEVNPTLKERKPKDSEND